jgi:hypothetical protein
VKSEGSRTLRRGVALALTAVPLVTAGVWFFGVVQRESGLLPEHRIVAFYGTPASSRMGVLGALPPEEMLARLREQAETYTRADPHTPVLRALDLVTVIAGRDPGPDGLYRQRTPFHVVEQVRSWTEADSLLLFLDIQSGWSPVVSEVLHYLEFLREPRVHLALDPEWAMRPELVPAEEVGSLDAVEVNQVIDILADLVREEGLPPKILVVHRFTEGMLRGYERIRLDPAVQVVINMDGFGSPQLKTYSYREFVAEQPVQFTGVKLFYELDRPLMDPESVLSLEPPPLVVMYQ